MYDYLIVGSGIFGAVFAHEATKKGKRCLVIDKRNHIGGNMYTRRYEGINIHEYGPHIFHTNDEKIWKYINQFTTFNSFVYSPLARYYDKYYNLPFNMNTFYQLWGIQEPAAVKRKINEQAKAVNRINNLEDQAISLVGVDVFNTLIKEYTEKQWGRSCKDLPKSIIKRLPVRYTYDNNYYNDRFQGMPDNGYTEIFEKLLDGIEVKLETDFFGNIEYFQTIAQKILYTGPIDRFFKYKYGQLEYRSLLFESLIHETDNYQGIYVVNQTSHDVQYTRSIEHRHFDGRGNDGITVITKEYPQTGTTSNEPYYPINDEANNLKYNLYKKESTLVNNVIFGGRLAEYKYYDMHQVIASALRAVKEELEEK